MRIRTLLPVAALVALCALFLRVASADMQTRPAAAGGNIGRYEVTVEHNLMVPMRDGVRLSTDVYRPVGEGPFPVILIRTPYGGTSTPATVATYSSYARRGYVVVSQDVRGRFDSEGGWYPYINEINDGDDMQQWAGTQPWSNGSVGMLGGSYLASAQWLPARMGNPHLKAIVPAVTPFNYYHDVAFVGGALSLSSRVGWAIGVGGRTGQTTPTGWEEKLRHLPLITMDRHLGWDLPHWQDWVRRPSYDAYWQVIDNEAQIPNISAAVFNIGGWYDIFLKGTLASYTGMIKGAKTETARRGQKLLIGPWPHGWNRQKTGELDFGPEAVIDGDEIQLRWLDYWLKGEKNGVLDEPPVRLFVMGENKWRGEREWPLARTRFTKYYFHSRGSAKTLDGNGTLSTQLPGAEPADTFVYDPDRPVPTVGGSNMTIPAGPVDQRGVEGREDVLVFTSAPLESDLEVTGPINVTLYAASDAKDTDFTAKLVDVHPDGRAYNLQDGIIRARYRESASQPTLIEPGKVYQYAIDLWATSNLFKRGHRIRVDISSSNFPRFDRNPNTGDAFGVDAKLQKATQTIHHDERYPSHITLPVIPR
jgi:putative CocE/NonD family hydrolase